MKRNYCLQGILGVLAWAWALVMSVSCQDSLLDIGGSVASPKDVASSRVDSLDMEIRTVEFPTIYSSSNYALLGDISDPLYGDFRASYISRLQHAPGFTFTHTPHNGKVDSVYVSVNYLSIVGDSTVWQKAQAFEVTKSLPKSRYSTDLSEYIQGAKFLGDVTYTPQSKEGNHLIKIKVPNEVGNRFLEASKKNPHYFSSQDAFEENLLKGIYVKTTTGTGAVVSVYNTNLVIFYSYQKTFKSSKGTDSLGLAVATEVFANSKSQYIHNHFEHKGLDKLLLPNNSYSYIKSPAGVVTELRLTKERLTQMYKQYYATEAGNRPDMKWAVSNAALHIKVNTPEGTSRLSPPNYLLLLPQDSVKSFFEKEMTETSRPRTSFLSNAYSINARYFDLGNIARLVDEHLKNHAGKDASGQPIVKQDLVMLLIPVQRSVGSGSGNGQTMFLYNYLYPAGARLDFSGHNKRIGIVSTLYYDR